MAIDAGSRLGPYDVTGLLGAGGMGEVYRARDTQLNRNVALKVLPTALAKDSDRLARFRREAQLLGALNHPNIAQIYGLHQSEEVLALVMEFVEGGTLEHRLAAGGPVPVDQATEIARQLVAALDAAHSAGIVHRDLKPANIVVRADGTVKVLDFGLAKAVALPEHADESRTAASATAPPQSLPAVTQAGVILGTAAYMSPEQARGMSVDRRADIWAFGCVLYELLTGMRAFDGKTVTDLLAAIIHNEPDFSRLPASTTPALRELLVRCLQKDVVKRMRDVGDVPPYFERHESGPVPESTVNRWRTHAVAVALASLAGLALVLGATWLTRARARPPVMQLDVSLPEEATQGQLGRSGASPFPAISPDGRYVAFTGPGADGGSAIWVRTIETQTTRRLDGTDGATRPFWSPDSASIGFFASPQLKKVALANGRVDVICACDVRLGGNRIGATWSRQGLILFGAGANLQRVADAGGAPQPVPIRVDGPSHPQFLPDGRRFLVIGRPRTEKVFLASLDSDEATEVLQSDSHVVLAGGHVLYSRNGTLMAAPFDVDTGRTRGPSVPLSRFQVTDIFNEVALSASEMESSCSSHKATNRQSLCRGIRTGARLGTLGPSRARFLNPALSPDASRVAVAILTQQLTYDLWLIDVRRGTSSRFTFNDETEFLPAWSPDRTKIAYTRGLNGPESLYTKRVQGSGEEQALGTQCGVLQQWSADGQRFWCTRNGLKYLPLSRPDEPVVYLPRQFNESTPYQSPDGKWVAFVSLESGRPDIYIRPFPDASGGKWQVTFDGAREPHWRADGRELSPYLRRRGVAGDSRSFDATGSRAR